MKPNQNANGAANHSNGASDFLPQGYEAPQGSNNYMKLQKGENRFRILSKPIIGWLDWKDQKPFRFRMSNKPDKPFDPTKPIKHFWAMIVYNVTEQQIQIIEITQATIQAAIQHLSVDADWGNPFDYDIKVSRAGEKLDTVYTITPCPKKPVTDDVKQAYFDKQPINIERLFDGEDPFEKVLPSAPATRQPDYAMGHTAAPPAVVAGSTGNDDLPF